MIFESLGLWQGDGLGPCLGQSDGGFLGGDAFVAAGMATPDLY